MENAKTYNQNELLELRKIHLQILKEVERICDKYNLEYVAVSGTALGARRHSGYIPWDDDIDIAFIRKDYEKFLKIASTELDSNYFLQNYKTEENSIAYFTKIKKSNTVFLQKGEEGIEMHTGIFIDIFPLDFLSNSKIEKTLYRFKLIILYQMYIAKSTKNLMAQTNTFNGTIKHYIRRILHFLMKPISKKNLYLKLDRHIQKYNGILKDEVMESPVFASNGISIPYDFYFPTTKHAFEDIQINVPNKCDAYLKIRYGNDYMKLPPKSKRLNHRPIILLFDKKESEPKR